MSILGKDVMPKTFFSTVLGVAIAVVAVFFAGLWAGAGKCQAAEPTTITRSHEAVPDQPDGTAVMITNVAGVETCEVFVPEDAPLKQKFSAWVDRQKCKVRRYRANKEQTVPEQKEESAKGPSQSHMKT